MTGTIAGLRVEVAHDRRLAEDRRRGKPPRCLRRRDNRDGTPNRAGDVSMIRVSLLGTGTPVPAMNRFGPSILIEAGGQTFLFDAGRGAMQRLAQLKVRWQDVDGLFLTHLHSDHVVGFPDLWLTGWLVGSGRDRPLLVWGPRGTKRMMSHLEQAYDFDIRIRLYDDRTAPDGA